MAKTFSLIIVSLLLCPPAVSAEPTRRFDDYGTVRWEDEKLRLDNLAVYLHESKDDVVYLLVVDGVGGCPGEALPVRYVQSVISLNIEVCLVIR